MIRQIVAVARKDLLVELRSPGRLSGLFFFCLALLLVVGFATNTTDTLRRQAGAILWVGLLLASTRSFDQSFATEMEQGALEGMVLWPVHPIAIYYGKAIANAVVLGVVALAMTPLAFAIFDADLRASPLLLLGFLVLGCTSLAAPGTFFAMLATHARGGSVLLPLLLFPMVMPSMLAAARGTTLVMEGAMSEETAPALLTLLATINVVHWSLAGPLFARVVEDG